MRVRRTPLPPMLVLGMCLLGCVFLMMGCSTGGRLWLKNATDRPIEILGWNVGDPNPHVRFRLTAGEVQRVSVANWQFRQVMTIRSTDGVRCFHAPGIEVSWVRSTFSGGEAIAILENNDMFYLYRPDEDKSTVFNHPPPEQPPGFPLASQAC